MRGPLNTSPLLRAKEKETLTFQTTNAASFCLMHKTPNTLYGSYTSVQEQNYDADRLYQFRTSACTGLLQCMIVCRQHSHRCWIRRPTDYTDLVLSV